MRSMKVFPCSLVILITMRSLMTRVPPVTALRSPPLSRMTGALSPVIADSSTVAMPSTTSPSPGIASFVSQTTRSPFFSSLAATFSSTLLVSKRAIVVVRILRSVAAWALPRPSAMASAKFAKSSVNQSQSVSCKWKLLKCAKVKNVVRIEPMRTTNITGFFHCTRGSSLRKESRIAGRISSGSRMEDFGFI